MNTTDVNYSPLISQWGAFKNRLIVFFTKINLWKLLVSITVVSIFVLAFLYFPASIIAVWAGFCGLFLLFVYASSSSQAEYNWKSFAKVNDWAVGRVAFEDIPPSLQGMSGVQPTSMAVIAHINGRRQAMFTCYGDLPYFIICVSLPKIFPHMVLKGMRNNGGSQYLFENSRRVSLEGDFDRYFRLYIDKKESIDALSIITPDVMNKVIDENFKEDLEIIGSNLYFISTMPKITAKSVQTALEAAQHASEELLHRAKTLNYVPQSPKIFSKQLFIPTPRVILTFTKKSKILLITLAIPIIAMAIYMFIFARNFKP